MNKNVSETLTIDSNQYALVETDSMENVFLPIKNTARVKYTCFDVSQQFVVFGSTSGGIYVFIRDTLQYLKSVTNKDGPVSQVAIAPDDSILAFSTSRGHVVVLEHNADKEGVQPHRLQFTYDHKGALVTSLHWSNTTARLYAGDDAGRVSMINVSLSRTRSLFQVPSATLMKVDSRVVQLDYSKDFLLVSSLTRSYIFNTNTEQWVQIGKKLRDGEFGACLYPGPRYQDPCTIYTARPGARLWEADLRGNVLSTHQFKAALGVSAAKLTTYKNRGSEEGQQGTTASPSSRSVVGFTKLYALWPSHELSPFILTWSSNGFCILNPKKAEVLLRCDEFTDIKCVKCYKSYLYINYQFDKFARIAVLPPDKAAKKLFGFSLYHQCASFMVENEAYFTKKKSCLSPVNLATLLDKLKEAREINLVEALEPLIAVILARENENKREKDETPAAKSVRRPRSALAHHGGDPNRSRRASPQPARCRSASPMLRQRHPSGSPPTSALSETLAKKGFDNVTKSQEEIRKAKFKPTHRKTKSDSNAAALISGMNIPLKNGAVAEKPTDVSFKPLPLALNGLLSPVDEGRHECSPVTNVPLPLSENGGGPSSPSSSLTLSLYNPSIASDTPPILNVDPNSELDLMSNSQATMNGSTTNGSVLFPSEELAGNTPPGEGLGVEGLNFDVSYRLLSLSVHGGGLVFPPGFDYSILSSHEAGDIPPIDLGKLKDSISSTFTSGKKVLLQNWKDLENRFKQMGVNETTAMVPKGFVHSNSSPSSTWDPADDGTNKENQGDPNGTYLDNRLWSSKGLHDSSIWEDSPSVDLSGLLSATQEARIRLRDPDILLDPIGRREVLQSWVNVLNETQLEVLHFAHNQTSPLQEPCDNEFEDIALEVNGNICQTSVGKKNHAYHPDFIPPTSKKLQLRDSSVIVYSPFRVSPEIHSQMSSLAVSCFRTKILGDSLSELSLFFPNSAPWESVPDSMNETPHHSDKNGNSEKIKDSRSLDCNLALFVSNYFHLLCGNSERREKQVEEFVHLKENSFCRESSGLILETRFKTWCAFNEGIQVLRRRDEFDRALQKNNLNACVESLLESFRITRVTISRIMQLSRIDYSKALEACLSLCHQMSPIDLLYISLCTGHRHPNLFLKCVDLILEETPNKHKSQIISSLFLSYEVRTNWIRFAINQPPETDGNLVNLRCSICGNPVPGSHLYQWPKGKQLLHILDTFGSDETTSQHLTQLCQEKGFWPGYLLLLKKRKETSKQLNTLLLLDDARLLSNEHPLGCFPEDERQWASFLIKLSAWHEKRKSAKGDPPWECSSCGAPIGPTACFSEKYSLTLDVAVRRMLSVFSPTRVIKIVRSLQLPNGALTSTTYRATLLTHLIDTQQSILSHSILARVESYLWLRRSTSIPPQIWKVFEEESRQRGSPLSDGSQSEGKVAEASLKQRCLRYLEEPENNWGVQTRIQRSCPLCGIQLCTNIFGGNRRTSQATGVTVGSCGHAFHSRCLGHQVTPCPLCVDRANLKKDNN